MEKWNQPSPRSPGRESSTSSVRHSASIPVRGALPANAVVHGGRLSDSRNPSRRNGFVVRTLRRSSAASGRFSTRGPQSCRRFAAARTFLSSVTRTKRSPPSATVRTAPRFPSWKDPLQPARSAAASRIRSFTTGGVRGRVAQMSAPSCTQSSGRLRSTLCCRIGFAPVPYVAYVTGLPGSPLRGRSVPRHNPPRRKRTRSPGFTSRRFTWSSVRTAVASLVPEAASSPRSLSTNHVSATAQAATETPKNNAALFMGPV